MAYNRAIREAVITLAVQQANDGAHYLWGSQGGTPNEKKEVRFNVKNLNPTSVSFCAAYCDRDPSKGPQVCGGRYAQKERAAVWKAPRGCGNPTSASNPALKAWIDENGSKSEVDWDDTLTPRLTKGTGVPVQIVWGEGCDGTRHFDCISFINWCLGKGKVERFTYDMYQYFYSIEPKSLAVRAEDVTNQDLAQVLPADVLLYGSVVRSASDYFQSEITKERAGNDPDGADLDQQDLDFINGVPGQTFHPRHNMPFVPVFGVGVHIHHIGFATGKSKGRVHAMDTANGVVMDDWGDPVRRIRLPDAFFL